ncbi:hypothetical protein [Granulosicoccus antarcticus]|uniref:Uncharacterized protein n=1 Tax=Granulosicoccus antarcticus IMCC3135 TaxID=1192854 RepID=A0A2Z2P294_9GAMM|nr:hypothetical protein [Granulosicoccus antarcticus]ASJ75430.1 hypothetical protein IMCC3135_26875 [Granulosicoccus antarcticus IMCC3135]
MPAKDSSDNKLSVSGAHPGSGFRAKAMHTCVTAATSLLLVLSLVAIPGQAQEIDPETDSLPPIIELEQLTEGVADRSQVFTVQIAEDRELQDATFYYRREGQLPFTPAPMEALGNTGYYSVSIPTDRSDLRTIEYYVQARDLSGNRTVSGFAFDPYRRTLQPSIDPLQSSDSSGNAQIRSQTDGAPTTSPRKAGNDSPLLQRRWVQITLGILAVGVVASLAQDDSEDSQVVPLTFNLQ